MGVTTKDLENWFSYHPPLPHQREKYEALRDGARTFAELVVGLTPASADQAAAVRKIREAVMTANAAIACDVGGQRPGENLSMVGAEPVNSPAYPVDNL